MKLKIIFVCLECGNKEEVKSEMFEGRVMTTCNECLKKLVEKPIGKEGPVYDLDLGEPKTSESSKWYFQPEATVTSLFLMNCKLLDLNPQDGRIKGFTFEENNFEDTITIKVKLKNGPLLDDLEEWYADKDTTPFVSSYISDIGNPSICSLNTLQTNDIYIRYCEDCDKLFEGFGECENVFHTKHVMTLTRFLNWKLLGRKLHD